MRIAILGGGRMGGALIRGMLASGITEADQINLSASTPESAERSASALGVVAATSNAGALKEADVVFLCVKPAKVLDVVSSVATELAEKLVISIVAGIHSSDIIRAAGGRIRLIRSMPNTAVRLRKGVTAIAPDATSTPADLETASRIFASVGSVVEVKESDLDTVTAVSGSGPAFALLMLEALAQGGVEGGLDPELSKTLATGALASAAALVAETGETPLALRAEITSPGGTTAAGLGVLDESNFPRIVRGAVRAARNRSAELSARPDSSGTNAGA
jgi:pyrroline-5-carboxylate reductase